MDPVGAGHHHALDQASRRTGRARPDPGWRPTRPASPSGSSMRPKWASMSRLPLSLRASAGGHLGGPERSTRAARTAGAKSSTSRGVPNGAEVVDQLGRVHHHDEAVAHLGHDLLAGVGPAPALGQVEGGVDLVGAVDGEVELAELIGLHHPQAQRRGQVVGCAATWRCTRCRAGAPRAPRWCSGRSSRSPAPPACRRPRRWRPTPGRLLGRGGSGSSVTCLSFSRGQSGSGAPVAQARASAALGRALRSRSKSPKGTR